MYEPLSKSISPKFKDKVQIIITINRNINNYYNMYNQLSFIK